MVQDVQKGKELVRYEPNVDRLFILIDEQVKSEI